MHGEKRQSTNAASLSSEYGSSHSCIHATGIDRKSIVKIFTLVKQKRFSENPVTSAIIKKTTKKIN
jgi:hypothetical protein